MPDDIDIEPVKGLPEALPAGEYILWQGRPDALALAREAFLLRWVAGWFGLLYLWRVIAGTADMVFLQSVFAALPLLAAGALACAIIYVCAWAQASTAVYTITTQRVAMRIGAALTVTFNIPLKWIGDARLDLRRDGTGTIAMQTTGDSKISYLVAWPHVRPWRVTSPEPALRCIPDAERVAAIFAEAAEARLSQPDITRAGLDRAATIAAE